MKPQSCKNVIKGSRISLIKKVMTFLISIAVSTSNLLSQGPKTWNIHGPIEIIMPKNEKNQMIFTNVKKPHTFYKIDLSFTNALISFRIYSASINLTSSLPVIIFNFSRYDYMRVSSSVSCIIYRIYPKSYAYNMFFGTIGK